LTGLVGSKSGALEDEGDTARVADDEARVCCDFEGVKSGEDIEDAIDDENCRVSGEDVLFPDTGTVWFSLSTVTGVVDSVCSGGTPLRFRALELHRTDTNSIRNLNTKYYSWKRVLA